MTTKNVDILNVGLILLSAFLAYQFPLQLFIVAFAILGPLHYLTEINWLDKKNYFTGEYKHLWMWVGIISSAIIVLPRIYFHFHHGSPTSLSNAIAWISNWSNSLIFLTLLAAFGFVFVKKKVSWVLLMSCGLALAILLNGFNSYSVIIGLLVPTIIHVYLFTLTFMLYGALKSKSQWGYFAVIFALLVPIGFAVINLEGVEYNFSDSMKRIYVDNRLYETPTQFSAFMGLSDGKTFYFHETLELRLMMFISFIYTYHYLNWFSKTSLIEWHKNLTFKSTALIAIAWAAMLGLFYYDFTLGFLVALFFSFLHVILEFPLNIVSIKGILKRQEKN